MGGIRGALDRLGPFLRGFILGLLIAALGAGSFALLWGAERRAHRQLEAYALQARRDLEEARDSQRRAQERARGLQEELGRIGDLARELQGGTDRLAGELGSAGDTCDELRTGIDGALDRARESARLLDELGEELRRMESPVGRDDSRP